jgi:hypothetical protein
MRFGAKNSTCAQFRKLLFCFSLLRKCLVSQGLRQHGTCISLAGTGRERARARGVRAPNAAILVAKSALSTCSASATRRADCGRGCGICRDFPLIFSE